MEKKAFTLIELIIVILIIGITASMGFSYFLKSRETTLGKDASASLRIIAAAQKIYRVETGSYWPTNGSTSTNLTDINNNLRVRLNSRSFDYSINATAGTSFAASAARIGTGGLLGCNNCLDCQYAVNQTMQVSAGVSCP